MIQGPMFYLGQGQGQGHWYPKLYIFHTDIHETSELVHGKEWWQK